MEVSDVKFIRLLEDELRVSKVHSPYIHRMLSALHSVRDIQDVATIVAQTLIAMDSSVNTAEKMLIDTIQRVTIQNIKG